MSIQELALDVLHGNFSHAYSRLQDWYSGLPLPVKTFLAKVGTQEYTILKSLTAIAVKDVVAGGFTTASFVSAGKDVLAQLIAQNISTFTIQDVMADLNMAASPLVPPATVA